MSGSVSHQGHQHTGDTPNAMVSISDENRVVQSGGQRSLGGGGTCPQQDHVSGSKPHQLAQRKCKVDGTLISFGQSVVVTDLPSDKLKHHHVEGEEDSQEHVGTEDRINNVRVVSDISERTGADRNDGASTNGLQGFRGSGGSQPSLSTDAILSTPVIDESNVGRYLSNLNKISDKSDNDKDQCTSNISLSTIFSDQIQHIKEDVTREKESSARSTEEDLRRSHRRRVGMFPSTNWKRVRNTLKAASEMQGIKKPKHALEREDSFLKKFSTRNHEDTQNIPVSNNDLEQRWNYSAVRYEGRFVIQHDGTFMFYWLGLITLAVLYNVWTCIARQAFIEIQKGCQVCWFTFDALFDFIYICDIMIQFRTGYLEQGLMVYNSRKLCKRYIGSKDIYIDFVCLLPLDFIQLAIGVHPMIRFPRFLKVYRTFRFIYMMESRTSFPNLFRVANLTHLVLLGSHWFAAFYYMVSEADNFSGSWAYPRPIGEFQDITRKYLQSLYWGVLTLSTIGDLPHPTNKNQ